MLKGVLDGELKLSKPIKRYLDLCLKCGACTKFCPSGIDIIDIVTVAKSEFFKRNKLEKLKSFILKYLIFGLFIKLVKIFVKPYGSKNYTEKVLFFGGCGSSIKGDKNIVKILNSVEVEVINPQFDCCGIPYFTGGDLKEFQNAIKKFINTVKKYDIKEIVVNCASCEKALRDYIKWVDNDVDKEVLKELKIKNIYEFLRKKNIKLKLKQCAKVTYHKPCNIDNFNDIQWLLNNTENLEYIEMKDFDKCCGFSGIPNFKEIKIMKNIYNTKRENIKNSGANIVLTSCLGCEAALKAYSFRQYKVFDFIEFIATHL